MGETRAELPFIGDQVVCLSHNQAARTGPRKEARVHLAEALAQQGEYGASLAAAREAIEAQEETGQRVSEAELHRIEGIALFGLDRLDEGQIALQEALRIARRQQAKSYELRAATSLARLWSEQGRRAEARELLAPVDGWFTEGFDTLDLVAARALLDGLAEGHN